jgi:hypothetical protein
MAQNKRLFIPPQVANVTTTTLLIGGAMTTISGPTGFTATQWYILLRHIRAVNTSATQYTVTMFYGSVNTLAAIWSATPVAGNSYIDWFGELRIDGTGSTINLWGGASNAAIYFNFDDAEIGFV